MTRHTPRLILLMSALILTAGIGVQAQETPQVRVVPNPSSQGQEVAAYGSGFCTAASCSAVTVKVDERVAASGVRVAPNGGFTAPFRVQEAPGQYKVTATQTRSDGSTIIATSGMVVAATDYPPGTTAPPPPAGTGKTATPPPNKSSPTTTITTQGSPSPATSPTARAQTLADEEPSKSLLPWWIGGGAAAAAIIAAVLVILIRRPKATN